jgi:hypothetical protein
LAWQVLPAVWQAVQLAGVFGSAQVEEPPLPEPELDEWPELDPEELLYPELEPEELEYPELDPELLPEPDPEELLYPELDPLEPELDELELLEDEPEEEPDEEPDDDDPLPASLPLPSPWLSRPYGSSPGPPMAHAAGDARSRTSVVMMVPRFIMAPRLLHGREGAMKGVRRFTSRSAPLERSSGACFVNVATSRFYELAKVAQYR